MSLSDYKSSSSSAFEEDFQVLDNLLEEVAVFSGRTLSSSNIAGRRRPNSPFLSPPTSDVREPVASKGLPENDNPASPSIKKKTTISEAAVRLGEIPEPISPVMDKYISRSKSEGRLLGAKPFQTLSPERRGTVASFSPIHDSIPDNAKNALSKAKATDIKKKKAAPTVANVIQGYLGLWEPKKKQWKRRWFQVEDTVLSVYKKQKGKKILEKKLTTGSFKTFPEDETLFEFSISGEVSLLVYAASVKERDKWKEEVARQIYDPSRYTLSSPKLEIQGPIRRMN